MKTPTRMLSKSDNDTVSSLLVPVQGKSLLVPNVAVAELVPATEIEAGENLPTWCLGYVHWRGIHVPVISFELANSQVSGRNSVESRLAIFNCIGDDQSRPYFAIMVQGIPRMIKLTDNEIREDKQTTIGQAESMAVITQLGKAIIPNIDYLESLAAKV
ncbi:chemotaxis protein CheW [Reinekea marina]|uniref:Chemotaxis protein CheW n=1 Tax=Reinekea marina TaxID=1310421 RepID=A0ABV7WQ99_9GAMM|nr:chemotaxis protein CheW [Reinekea marina]MDN3650652.1 chemotaxis protein CheW [Reinekea marina]